MVLPRMAALAEVQGTQLEKKDYTNFTTRLAGLIGLYRRDGLNYREPFRQPVSYTHLVLYPSAGMAFTAMELNMLKRLKDSAP